MAISSSSSISGLVRKSKAPRRIASTADFDRAVAGDHDDGGGRLLLAAVGQQIEAVVVAQADIDQHQIVGLAVDGGDALGQAGGRIGLVALLAEPVGHRGQHVAIVVHQQQCAALLHAKHPSV